MHYEKKSYFNGSHRKMQNYYNKLKITLLWLACLSLLWFFEGRRGISGVSRLTYYVVFSYLQGKLLLGRSKHCNFRPMALPNIKMIENVLLKNVWKIGEKKRPQMLNLLLFSYLPTLTVRSAQYYSKWKSNSKIYS